MPAPAEEDLPPGADGKEALRPTARVLILCPYPSGRVAGQRFSYEQYFDVLKGAGIETTVEPFLDEATWNILYKPGHYLEKVSGVIRGFLRRICSLAQVFDHDFVFIFREAAPLGPPIFEAILFLLRRKVVYYFDDAIFIRNTTEVNGLVAYLKWASKVQYIVARCHKVVGANKFLCDWALRFNPRVVKIPSTIDPSYHRPPQSPRASQRRKVVGWTGSHSTARYLDILRPVLESLQKDHDFEFRVICDVDPGFPELTRYRFVKWRLESEIEDLSAFDIGVMPVPEGDWELGKVGMKAIQYSAIGIPSVVSATGSGHDVVVHGQTGLVVDNSREAWRAALASLLKDEDVARKFGAAARDHALRNYSVPSQARAYISLFEPAPR